MEMISLNWKNFIQKSLDKKKREKIYFEKNKFDPTISIQPQIFFYLVSLYQKRSIE